MGQENTGLLITDFIYPNNLIVFNVDYSLKRYNFVKQTYMSLDKLPIINSPAGTVIVNYVDSQTITLEVKPTIANGSQTKVSAGQNVTILGTGTTLDPYIVSSFTNINAGSGITITGLGTTLNPYLITSKSDLQYDTKEIVCDSLYLSNNFDLTPGITMGLGKNLRLGWAIMNGNNGTLNDDGRVVVGYGTSYNILNDTAGSKDAVVVAHNHTVNAVRTTSVALPEGGSGAYGTNQTLTTSTVGESGIDKNMQPYVVRLRIMKL